MASVALTESEVEECKTFLQSCAPPTKEDSTEEKSVQYDPHFESFCFCMTDAEINGEVIDIINRYLHLKYS